MAFPEVSRIDLPARDEDGTEAGSGRNAGVAGRAQTLLGACVGVIDLACFGSVVRDEENEDSYIDVRVAFYGPATSAHYFVVQFYLEDLLSRSADLVTDKAMRSELRPTIESEAVYL